MVTLKKLSCLPAKVLHLHLASCHLITSELKATMARHLYDILNPSTIDGSDVSQSQVAPPSLTPQETLLSTNQLTTTNATYPSLMAQFLQYATLPAGTSHKAAWITSNLFPASTVHAPNSLCHWWLLPPRSTTVTAMTGHFDWRGLHQQGYQF